MLSKITWRKRRGSVLSSLYNFKWKWNGNLNAKWSCSLYNVKVEAEQRKSEYQLPLKFYRICLHKKEFSVSETAEEHYTCCFDKTPSNENNLYCFELVLPALSNYSNSYQQNCRSCRCRCNSGIQRDKTIANKLMYIPNDVAPIL